MRCGLRRDRCNDSKASGHCSWADGGMITDDLTRTPSVLGGGVCAVDVLPDAVQVLGNVRVIVRFNFWSTDLGPGNLWTVTGRFGSSLALKHSSLVDVLAWSGVFFRMEAIKLLLELSSAV